MIDEVLQAERNYLLGLALTALAATLIASVLLYRTIAGPVRRLSAAAENVSRNIGARAKLPLLAGRTDEVGQMNAAFRKMTESLYRRIEASELFAREVAHELKNPLTAARSTAEFLAYVKTPEMREELVRQIQGELSRLNRLISDVSDVSRLDAELAYGETDPVDIRDVLRGVTAIFQDRFSSDTRGLVLQIEEAWQPSDAFIVMGHEARLGRVITNLLDNAISFSPEDGIVAVCARRVGPEIEIVVDDDGPGIPPDRLDTIFERFYSDRPQSDSTLGKNSGLGLSISRDIIDAYGGHIEASNRMAAPGAAADASRPPRSQGAGGCPASSAPASRCGCRRPMRRAPKEARSLHDGVELVHGTCVALGQRAALLRGAPGVRQIRPRAALSVPPRARPGRPGSAGARRRRPGPLVHDGGRLLAAPPESIRGKIEVRGVGIVGVKWVAEAELVLVVDLVGIGAAERLPEWAPAVRLLGIDLPLLGWPRSENSAPIKLALALAHAGRS